MAKTLRVHTLAKELGVASKDVIAKCRAEGVDVKNHMTAISLGLAESIREWFSAGDDVTTIEVAERVDLQKVVRKPAEEPSDISSESLQQPEAAVSVAEPEPASLEPPIEAVPELPEVEEPAPVVAALPEVVSEPEATPELEPVAEAPEAPPVAEPEPVPVVADDAVDDEEQLPPEVSEEPPTETAQPESPEEKRVVPVGMPNVPPTPTKPVTPVGPQLVPKPAELSGPRVVRIEAPDPVAPPRPRARPAAASRDAAQVEMPSPLSRGPRKRVKGKDEEREEQRNARQRRQQGTIADVDSREREWRDQDLLERKERLASATGQGLRERRAAERRRRAVTSTVSAPRKSDIELEAPFSVKSYCAAVGVPFNQVFKRLMEQTGRAWTITESMDAETAGLVSMELGVQIKIRQAKTELEKLAGDFEERDRTGLELRPPIVAMLGHVDHGKTSLLDAIRKADVAAGEAGGITQHIGAYRIDRGDWHVTFLDTPGHEAFTAMRARGANMTDVVVLVVAADDGVMPQTVEAMNHAKAAGVEIVVALNKIDLPGVDINKVYGQLAEHELTPSEWGGKTDVIKTSATSGEGIQELIAHLSDLSELMELRADPTVPAHGTVIESQMREGQGVVAQVLVREGTLKVGQTVVCGPGAGRVRLMRDDKGRRVDSAGPGTPVAVSGLDGLPSAGDALYAGIPLARAKEVAAETKLARRQEEMQAVQSPKATLEDLLRGAAERGEVPTLNVIVRGDVQGSVDALKQELGKFPTDKAKLVIKLSGVGAITEADIDLAQVSSAIVIGFHVVPDDRARRHAERLGVEIRTYRVIYEIIEDMYKALAGLLAPMEQIEVRGSAEVRQVFNVSRIGTIAGCYVTNGVVGRNHRGRLVRDGRLIVERAELDSLKRFKDDAREVRAGLECGIKLKGYDDIKPGDVIETFEVVEVAQEL